MITAKQMRKAMKAKYLLPLSPKEASRFLKEINDKLIDLRNEPGVVYQYAMIKCSSFIRDPENRGKKFPRDKRVEKELIKLGYLVTYKTKDEYGYYEIKWCL